LTGSGFHIKRLRIGQVAFVLLCIAFVEYGTLFIIHTSFLIEGTRFYSLFDDAMISMRYAKNLAAGYGLVWNPGYPAVEGYSNFLWTLLMAAFHLLPLSAAKMSALVQSASLLLLLINLVFLRKIALLVTDGSEWVAFASVFFTAFYFPLNNWALQGMEVGLLAMLTTLSLWEMLRGWDRERTPWQLSVYAALAILTRTETALLFGVLLLFWGWNRRGRGYPFPWLPVIVLLGTVIGHSLFRFVYYGDFLPNTFYLKMTGVELGARVWRGLQVFWEFASEASLLIFLTPLLLLWIHPEKRPLIALLMGAIAIQSGYSIWVGGDAWESYGGANRYIAQVMPVFMILLAWTLVRLPERAGFEMRVVPRGLNLNVRRAVTLVLLGFCFVRLTSPHWYDFLLRMPPLEAALNPEMVRQASYLEHHSDSTATVAVVLAGTLPYFCSRTCIDLLGKNDRVVARSQGHQTGEFVPGHNKWDYEYSILRLSPDIIVRLWEPPTPTVEAALRERYAPAFFPDGKSFLVNRSSRRVHLESEHPSGS
jgi:arabinofuranosyltransferase